LAIWPLSCDCRPICFGTVVRWEVEKDQSEEDKQASNSNGNRGQRDWFATVGLSIIERLGVDEGENTVIDLFCG